jgi:hypothetical protein
MREQKQETNEINKKRLALRRTFALTLVTSTGQVLAASLRATHAAVRHATRLHVPGT